MPVYRMLLSISNYLSLNAIRNLIHILAACFLLAALPSAFALDVDGLKLPDEFVIEGKKLVPNGGGTRLYSILKVKVYSAALYLPAKSSDANAILQSTSPRVVHLKMRLSTKRDDAQKAWGHFLDLNCKSPCAVNEARRAPFINAMSGLKEGDEETFIFTAAGLELKRNGTSVVTIPDPELAKLILSGWIGDEPTTAELKAAMLSGR